LTFFLWTHFQHGYGVVVRDLTAEKLAAALVTVTTDERIRKRAKEAANLINSVRRARAPPNLERQ